MEKPVVIASTQVGKEKQYDVYVVRVPGNQFAIVQVHRDWRNEVKVDPKTQEITLPGDAAWNLKPTPEGYIVMGFKGVISLFPKKAA